MTQTITLNTTPPSLNKAYRSYRGRVILSAEARAFKETLSQLKPAEKVLGKIHLEVKLTFPDKRKRDLDNYLKVLLDSMKHVFFEDDDQIYKLTVSKVIGAGKAETEIIINSL
jgi:crossover junction endodeoxyribonuclease RusA